MIYMLNLSLYKYKLIFRIFVVLAFFITLLFFREELTTNKYFDYIIFTLWLIIALELFIELFPFYNKHLSSGKMLAKHYTKRLPQIKSDKVLIREKNNTISRIIVGLIWFILMFVLAILYYNNAISEIHIIILVALFYLADVICINLFCPFRLFIIRSKCCVDCPIFNWGQLMNFIPLILIFHWMTISLVVLSFVIFLQWEILYHKYPERFSESTNKSLTCASCKEKNLYQNCTYKK